MHKVVPILADKNFWSEIVEHKNTLIQLFIQKFLKNFCNIITSEKTSKKLLSLVQKEEKDLYIYYCRAKCLFEKIHEQNKVINNSRNTMVLSLFKYQFL